MSFLKRFGFYLIGLSIGLVFLAVFLRKKSESTGAEFCYLPNCRVLKTLRTKPLVFAPTLESKSDSSIIKLILKEGDVIFSESEPRSKPCGVFVVRGKVGDLELKLTLQNCEEYTQLIDYDQNPDD